MRERDQLLYGKVTSEFRHHGLSITVFSIKIETTKVNKYAIMYCQQLLSSQKRYIDLKCHLCHTNSDKYVKSLPSQVLISTNQFHYLLLVFRCNHNHNVCHKFWGIKCVFQIDCISVYMSHNHIVAFDASSERAMWCGFIYIIIDLIFDKFNVFVVSFFFVAFENV